MAETTPVTILITALVQGEQEPRSALVRVDAVEDPRAATDPEAVGHFVLGTDGVTDLLNAWEALKDFRGYLPTQGTAGWSWVIGQVKFGPTGNRIIHDEWLPVTPGENQWSTLEFSRIDALFKILPASVFDDLRAAAQAHQAAQERGDQADV